MIETITRKQLYDLIWSKPLTKVQLEVGLTYNQIKNICNEKEDSHTWKWILDKKGIWKTINHFTIS